MAKQTINTGQNGNDGTGDSIRASFNKVNGNFNELYAIFGISGTIPFSDLSDAPSAYAPDQIIMASHDGNILTARTIISSDNTVVITTNSNSVLDIRVNSFTANLVPQLSGPLNVNLFPIGRLADPSVSAVAAYNATWEPLDYNLTTTINEMPVTVNYGIKNYVAGIASNITNNIAANYSISANLTCASITSTSLDGPIGSVTQHDGTFSNILANASITGPIGSNVQHTGSFTDLTASGEFTVSGNMTAYFTSDSKYKENVRNIDHAIDKVVAIGGKLFDWTDIYADSHVGSSGYFTKADFGVIAQDVLKVFPIAVKVRSDASLAVDYVKLVSLAFAAIKEQQLMINRLLAITDELRRL